MSWPCAWSHCLIGRWTFSPAWGPKALDQVFIKCVSALCPIPGGLLCSLSWGEVSVWLLGADWWLRYWNFLSLLYGINTPTVCVMCVVVLNMSRRVYICVYIANCQHSIRFTTSLRASSNSKIQFLHDLKCFHQPSIWKSFSCSDTRWKTFPNQDQEELHKEKPTCRLMSLQMNLHGQNILLRSGGTGTNAGWAISISMAADGAVGGFTSSSETDDRHLPFLLPSSYSHLLYLYNKSCHVFTSAAASLFPHFVIIVVFFLFLKKL